MYREHKNPLFDFIQRRGRERHNVDSLAVERDDVRGMLKLQAGDPECLELWGRFREISLSHCQEIYELLNVKLTMADVMGESAYNDDLINVVNDLKAKGMLVESNGAQCVFLDEFIFAFVTNYSASGVRRGSLLKW